MPVHTSRLTASRSWRAADDTCIISWVWSPQLKCATTCAQALAKNRTQRTADAVLAAAPDAVAANGLAVPATPPVTVAAAAVTQRVMPTGFTPEPAEALVVSS